jgi:hypothetical protein
MALGGLWHGASWNFAIWGLLHGSGPSPHILARSPHVLTPLRSNLRHLADVSRVGLFVGAFTLLDDSFDPVQAWIVAVGAHYYAFFGIAFSPRPTLSISLK